VTFYIGKNKTPFSIHSGFLEAFSESISRSVSVLEDEPNKSVASLEDVDESTFGRCCQVVYTNDYSVPEPTFTTASGDGDKVIPQLAIEKDLLNMRNNTFHPAELLSIPKILQVYVDADLTYEPRPDTTPEEDYSEIFLCHARLYRFAFSE